MDTRLYITSGDLARMIGCPLHRVTYALQRLQIREDARAGAYRLFASARAPGIIAAIREIGSQSNEEPSIVQKA